MNIGQAIRTLRTKQNMTQADLAKHTGVSLNTVSAWELGKTFPTTDTIKRICDAFGVPTSYLLLSTMEEKDMPEAKRVLYQAMVEPLRNELLEDVKK